MNDTVFDTAKNGMRSCTVRGVRLHSAYDPQKEADRFVAGLQPDFAPAAIIVTEPALSYCTRPLKERFPAAKIGAVRFSTAFTQSDAEWDFIIPAGQTANNLLSVLDETELVSTLFLSWEPSQRAFPERYAAVRKEIGAAIETARDVLGTRAYFAERWMKNACRFCLSVRRTALIAAGDAPVVVAASGPSLEASLPYIRRLRQSIFLIAVSSAYGPLVAAEIRPDVCISTDGGYWAKKHIERCAVPFAVSAESAVPETLLERELCIPLYYGDAPEAELLRACGIPAIGARRNGTVSGTAAELALTLTSGPVFACGLDLASGKGVQHARPNALEAGNAARDYRLNPAQTRLYPSEFESGSLAVYRGWFAARDGDFKNRFFRLTADTAAAPADTAGTYGDTAGASADAGSPGAFYAAGSMLGSIRTLNWNDAIDRFLSGESAGRTKPSIRTVREIPDQRKRYEILKTFFSDGRPESLPETWLSALAPAEFALWKRNRESHRASSALEEKIRLRLQRIRHVIERRRPQ